MTVLPIVIPDEPRSTVPEGLVRYVVKRQAVSISVSHLSNQTTTILMSCACSCLLFVRFTQTIIKAI